MARRSYQVSSGLALSLLVACGGERAGGVAPRAAQVRSVVVAEWVEAAPRGPVLVREGDELALWHRVLTDGRWRRRSWNAAELGPEEESRVGPPGGDELDLGAIADESARISSSSWRNGLLLDGGERVGWAPDAAPTGDGLHVAFDRFVDGDYDVFHRGPDGREVRLAGSERFEANASVAVDAAGRVFVAWDEGRASWGRGGALHRARRTRLAVRDGEAWNEVELPPLLEGARGKGSEGFSAAELPRLVADENGSVWLFYRAMARWNRIEAAGERGDPDTGSNRRVLWQQRAVQLSASGWSAAETLPSADGAGYDSLVALALPGGGVAVAYESDGRMRNFPKAAAWETPLGDESRLVAAEVYGARGGAEGEALPLVGPLATGRTAPATPLAPADPSTTGHEGFVRLWGDLHRHSDLSRCKMDEDGNALAQYRYALDVERLDFLALTEHYQHMTPGHWAYLSELVERFDAPERLAAMYGFEQAQTTGHRNLVSVDPAEAADAPFRPWNPRTPWAGFQPSQWIAIPHQLADPTVPLEWPRHREAVESAVEVYQSRRGSYVSSDDPLRSFGALRSHEHALDWIRAGRRFGFVAASDHLTTASAFTAVYARSRDRDAVFEALDARRSYAATARIALDVELAGAIVGEAVAAPADAVLKVEVDAGAELARVEVLRGGEVAWTWAGPEGAPPLLTVRMGPSVDSRVVVRLEGARWSAPPIPLRERARTGPVEVEEGLLLEAELDAWEDVGLVGPVAVADPIGENAVVRLLRDRREAVIPMNRLVSAGPELTRVGPAPVELRLDPPAYGARRLSAGWAPGNWRPGDWVVVRVVRVDGEMAWSSPIWIEAESE